MCSWLHLLTRVGEAAGDRVGHPSRSAAPEAAAVTAVRPRATDFDADCLNPPRKHRRCEDSPAGTQHASRGLHPRRLTARWPGLEQGPAMRVVGKHGNAVAPLGRGRFPTRDRAVRGCARPGMARRQATSIGIGWTAKDSAEQGCGEALLRRSNQARADTREGNRHIEQGREAVRVRSLDGERKVGARRS